MDSKEQIFFRLQNSPPLPSLPQVLLKLIKTCDKNGLHLSELSQLIAKDVSISSRVLGLVNSAYYSPNNTSSNIDQAVEYLGVDTIKTIVHTASVQQVYSKLLKNKHFSMRRFWCKSFCAAIYAKQTARQISYLNIEEAYLAGLLHDLGELLLWVNFANKCAMVPALIEDKAIHQCIAEEEQIGINHCEAGAWQLKQWNLTPLISDAVLYHHSSFDQIKSAFPLVKIVYFAEQCCEVVNDDFEAVSNLGKELFGLTAMQFCKIRENVAEETREVAENFGIEGTPPFAQINKQSSVSAEYEDELLHQVRHYSLLHGFMEDLVQAENRDAIFSAIEKALNILFDIDTIFFFLYDFELKKLFGNASKLNPNVGQMESLVISAEAGTSLLVKSMLERESIISFQATDSPLEKLADSQLLDVVGGKGMLYIPMVTKKKPVGVIVVRIPDSINIGLSNPMEYKFLQLLADQAAISLYSDVLKQKQDEEFQAARMEAVSMAAAKAVHGINNPLAVIRNYTKILELEVSENESVVNAFTIIDAEIDRISAITQKIDNFSNPVKQKFQLMDINALLSDLLSILSKSVFYSSKLQIHFSPDPDLPAIQTDGSSIKQIIINLIKNSAEAMSDGGNVYIKTNSGHEDDSCAALHDADVSNYVKITLLDDGPGVPDTVLSQVFEPFVSTKGKGHSGLGLSLVRTLVRELKGSVKCSNRKGNGALFTIVLPVE